MDAKYLQNLADEAIAMSALTQRKYQPTIIREFRKIGRNEPCNCGSGIKNKKCCNTN